MFVYRVSQSSEIESAFSGLGSKRSGGRWNSKGAACIYMAETLSLAILEVLVHTNNGKVSEQYSGFVGELADEDFFYLEEDMLPEGWDSLVDFSDTALIGDAWLKEFGSLALLVPSAVTTLEYNVIINPFHEDFERFLGSVVLVPHAFDPRLVSEES